MFLPMELILIISDLLLYNDDFRTLVKLNKCFNINPNKYLYDILKKHRLTVYSSHWVDKIIFWNKTGIDDGVPPDYLLKYLNNDTQLYRTIHSHPIVRIKGGKHGILFDKEMSFARSKYFRGYISNIIIDDNRPKPDCIKYKPDTLIEIKKKMNIFKKHKIK